MVKLSLHFLNGSVLVSTMNAVCIGKIILYKDKHFVMEVSSLQFMRGILLSEYSECSLRCQIHIFLKKILYQNTCIIFHKEVVIVKGSIIVSSMYWNRVILYRKYYSTIVYIINKLSLLHFVKEILLSE